MTIGIAIFVMFNDFLMPANLSFENTEFAFAYKSDKSLKKADFLFTSMGKPWLLKLGLLLTPLAIRWRLPFTSQLIRTTLFEQFIGGESLEETAGVAHTLGKYAVQVILDYGVEGGHDGEPGFEAATKEFIRVIRYAATQPNIPFISVKVTGVARFSLMEKLDEAMHLAEGTLMNRYRQALDSLMTDENEEWQRVYSRIQRVCESAASSGIGVLIDAEESWIQDPVDALTLLMMETFNKDRVVIYNTVQLYRNDRLTFLHQCHAAAVEKNFVLGVKLVRGAYMEKERARAMEKGYASPIQPDKSACDHDFDEAVRLGIQHLDRIALIVASHNEKSNLLAAQLLETQELPLNHPRVHFSQLYGMSDNITFNLARAGCNVSKYLPFGPIRDVVPYLLRRAQENSAVSGQTGRELALIRKERARRGS